MQAVEQHKETCNDFIDIIDISYTDLRHILDIASKLKKDLRSGIMDTPLQGKQLAMIFEKPSTRTRVSFEVGINQLGGNAIILSSQDMQLGRGESIADTARVLSRYVDLIMIRTFKHDTLTELAEHTNIPVINGLTDYSHPCQVMADIMTFEEHCGPIEDKIITYIGDCNNMANTWIQAAALFNFSLRIACPEELSPPSSKLSTNTKIFTDPVEAVKDAHCVTTDTWVSMGDEHTEGKLDMLAPYQVNDALMEHAKEAIFLHCLPAHRGHEVTNTVIEGAQSKVWDEAENRLHIQKAIMLWCSGVASSWKV